MPFSEQATPAGFVVYTIGLLLAVILTITSFWVGNENLVAHTELMNFANAALSDFTHRRCALAAPSAVKT